MAGAASNILVTLELGGVLDAPTTIQAILSALNPNQLPAPLPVNVSLMEDLLTVINNWEKATGHKIKNPEAKITGTLKVDQRTSKPVLVAN